MRKEQFAAALLAVIMTATIINIFCIKNIIGEMKYYANAANTYASKGNWNSASESIDQAEKKWRDFGSYTQIVLKHEKIEAATDAIYELMNRVSHKDQLGTKIAAIRLKEMLDNIYEMERIRFGTVF